MTGNPVNMVAHPIGLPAPYGPRYLVFPLRGCHCHRKILFGPVFLFATNLRSPADRSHVSAYPTANYTLFQTDYFLPLWMKNSYLEFDFRLLFERFG